MLCPNWLFKLYLIAGIQLWYANVHFWKPAQHLGNIYNEECLAFLASYVIKQFQVLNSLNSIMPKYVWINLDYYYLYYTLRFKKEVINTRLCQRHLAVCRLPTSHPKNPFCWGLIGLPYPWYIWKPPEIRKLGGHIWKGGVVSHVPVKHVELVHLHQVQVVLDHWLGDVVPASVQWMMVVLMMMMMMMMMKCHLLVSSRIPRCVNLGESSIWVPLTINWQEFCHFHFWFVCTANGRHFMIYISYERSNYKDLI